MGQFSKSLFNALIERIIKKFYAFAESISESVTVRVVGESVQFWIDTTTSGGNAEYMLGVIPGTQLWVEESWGSQDYWDAWRITPGDSHHTVLVEYTGTVDGSRQFPEWLDFGDWEVEVTEEEDE